MTPGHQASNGAAAQAGAAPAVTGAAPTPACPPSGAVPSWEAPQAVTGSRGAVATDDGRCSQIGRQVLSDGGNAVDAAVAATLCLGVTHPMSSGIGGGCFILIYNATTGGSDVVDARETAPAGASEAMFEGKPTASTDGGAAVAVPGEVAGLWQAWQRRGRLPWARLVAPAAALAQGFTVDAKLAQDIASLASSLPKMRAVEAAARGPAAAGAPSAYAPLEAVFLPGGVPLVAGDTCRIPALSATLSELGAAGGGVFYGHAGFSPRIARAMVADTAAAGGSLSMADLQGYSPIWRKPLSADVLGVTLLGVPPPSSGGATVMAILQFLAGYPLPLAGAGSGLGPQRMVEAFKHAFALRMRLGDPADPYNAQVGAVVAAMLSPGLAQQLRALSWDNATRPSHVYGGNWSVLAPPPEDHGTTHVSVVDGQRSAVALTSTINTGFGSKVLTAAGVLMNDEMDDFSTPGVSNAFGLAPSRANYIRPGKRPLSSMSPTIVLQGGRVRLVAGASGGPRIITATAQTLLGVLALGRTPLAAVDAPRLHHQLLADVLKFELNHTLPGGGGLFPGTPGDELAALAARGHVLKGEDGFNGTLGTVQLVAQDMESGVLTAVSDVRKGGLPAAW